MWKAFLKKSSKFIHFSQVEIKVNNRNTRIVIQRARVKGVKAKGKGKEKVKKERKLINLHYSSQKTARIQ